MKTEQIFIFLIVVSLAYCDDNGVNTRWDSFKKQHKKSYKNTKEETNRYRIWSQRYDAIHKHNQANKDFKLKINEFADMTDDEIKAEKFGLLDDYHMVNAKRTVKRQTITTKNVSIPDSLNYTDLGYVTNVKDQKSCGGCWAFAATGALEGQYFKKYQVLHSFSEQNLIDCSSSSYGTYGCSGGRYTGAFLYVKNVTRISNSTTYPFIGSTSSCQISQVNTVYAKLSGYQVVPKNETSLLQALVNVGPIAIGVDASKSTFWYYSSGVYYDSTCSSTMINHAVLLVGYGTENGQDYWLVKNSWSKSWGMNGYIKMARNRGNNCGIATLAVYPVLV